MAKDIHVGINKNKLMFILHTSKTHNEGMKPQVIKITSQSNRTENPCTMSFCPFQAIKDYLRVQQRYRGREPFFVFRDGSPVKANQFRTVLHRTVKFNKLNVLSYNIQGFRVGRSSDLLDLGLSVETIKKLGRWRSSAVHTYLCP